MISLAAQTLLVSVGVGFAESALVQVVGTVTSHCFLAESTLVKVVGTVTSHGFLAESALVQVVGTVTSRCFLAESVLVQPYPCWTRYFRIDGPVWVITQSKLGKTLFSQMNLCFRLIGF